MGAQSLRNDDPFGDFQTPQALAAKVWDVLNIDSIDLLVEPTVGIGAFLATSPAKTRRTPWLAWDINSTYVEITRQVASRLKLNATVNVNDVFLLDPAKLESRVADKTVLLVGNPPWITSAAQAATAKRNLPTKWNRFGLRGLDAKTGKANFDIAEAILLSMLAGLQHAREVKIGFLLKRSVAVKIACNLLGTPGITNASFSRINTREWFDTSVEAGLFQLSISKESDTTCSELLIFDSIEGTSPAIAGVVNGSFVSDMQRYDETKNVEATAASRLPWRQGIKHDVARILELKPSEGRLVNGLGEIVDIEDEILCPFYKSSDIAAGRDASRRFPLYQESMSGPHEDIAERWPKLAAYLRKHHKHFSGRRSSIYKGKPDFTLFGVGPYTLAPFKIAISGFYKQPNFRVVGPADNGLPPILDDTCYLLPFDNLADATVVADYLNSVDVHDFLVNITDRTAKRPYTKDILSRIATPVK